MKVTNPFLLAEIDTLEEITRKDASELEVVKHIEVLEEEVRKLTFIIDNGLGEKDFINDI